MIHEPNARSQPLWPVGTTVVVSIVAHAIGLALLAPLLQDDTPYVPPKAKADAPLRVRVVQAPDDLPELEEANRDRITNVEEPDPEPKKIDELPYLPSKEKVADLQPEDSVFSGRQNTQADKDTIKRGTEGSQLAILDKRSEQEPKIASPPPSPAASSASSAESSVEQSPEKTEDASQKTDRTEEPDPLPRESDIILPTRSSETKDGATSSSDTPSEGDPRSTGPQDAKGLFPTASDAEVVANKIGDGGTFDYLKDVDEGDRTLLNRQQNRYWVFYDRMQRQVERNWKARKEWRKRDPFGNVYGVGSFYTVIAMTLNSDGSIRRIRVSKSSGKEFLDDEAARALTAAGPFPNPPEGMKDEDGLIHINFGFMFEVVSGGIRLFQAKPQRPF